MTAPEGILGAAFQWKGVLAFGWFAVFFLLERLARAAPEQSGAYTREIRTGRNLLIALPVFAMTPLIVLPIALWADAHALWRRPDALSGAWTILVDIVLLDLWTYFVHRAYHETPLWRVHRVHHLDEHLDTTSALRFHFAEVALSGALRVVPILALGIPFLHVVLFETVLFLATVFHHSNLKLPHALEAGLSRVFVTPSIHWVHHHAVRADTNSNYAGIFSLWDRLFATRSMTARTPELKIGVEGIEDQRLLPLLLLSVEKDRTGK